MTNGRTNRMLASAIAIIAIAFLIILFHRGFSDPSEGRGPEISREMVAKGDWLEMRLLGYRYYEKPPLTYWLVAPAVKLFGAHDWAARVPLLFSGLAVFLLLWAVSIKHFGRQYGWSAVLVMGSLVGFLAGNAMLLTDSFLMPLFAATCLFFYLALENNASPGRRAGFLLLGAVGAVLGFLTKGAVGVVLPAAIVFFWLLWEKRLKNLFSFSVLPAILLFVLLLLPILWLIEKHNPGFARHFLFEEHIARFLGTRQTQLHPEPFWWFLMVLPLLLLPWTLFLFRAARNIYKKEIFKNDSFSRFLFVWLAVVICFFSAGTGKLMSYILPAIPPLGLLIGRWGVIEPVASESKWDRRLWKTGVAGFVIVLVVISAGWLFSFFRILPAKVYPVSAVSAIVLLPMLAAALVVFRSKTEINFAKLVFLNSGILLTCALLLSPLAGKDFNVLLHINSSFVYKNLAVHLKPEDRIVVFWSYRPALPFYTRRLYLPFQEKNELSYGMQMEPDRPADLQSAAELKALWKESPGRIFALVEPQDLKTKFLPLNIPFKETDLPQDPDTIIYELIRPSDM